MKCLADNTYFESRGEPIKGQLLVARATLNRAKPYGSICTAVYEPYQFSWTMMPKKPKINEELYKQTEKAAYMALYYNSPVYYFHNKQVKPKWAHTKVEIARVGNHIFYKEPTSKI
jgi:spore germination cell wall hydrolase CwlJ-like protein